MKFYFAHFSIFQFILFKEEIKNFNLTATFDEIHENRKKIQENKSNVFAMRICSLDR